MTTFSCRIRRHRDGTHVASVLASNGELTNATVLTRPTRAELLVAVFAWLATATAELGPSPDTTPTSPEDML